MNNRQEPCHWSKSPAQSPSVLEVRVLEHFEKVGGTQRSQVQLGSLTLVSEPWCVQCDTSLGMHVRDSESLFLELSRVPEGISYPYNNTKEKARSITTHNLKVPGTVFLSNQMFIFSQIFRQITTRK